MTVEACGVTGWCHRSVWLWSLLRARGVFLAKGWQSEYGHLELVSSYVFLL